jgi:hypothetical protein
VEINRNGRFILSNENSLLIAQARKVDGGNYTCVASNIAGTYSSEPAELIIHGIEQDLCFRTEPLWYAVDNRGWSEWQPFSECKGIPCSTGRQRRTRICLNPPTITNRPSCDGEQMQERECPVPCVKDAEDSEWSDCVGMPCQIGKQQRLRACSKQSNCQNEQIEERKCSVPCVNSSSSTPAIGVPNGRRTDLSNAFMLFLVPGVYSNWTNWSTCQPPECTSVRSRQCLHEPCLDYLIESRSCKENLCSSKDYFR